VPSAGEGDVDRGEVVGVDPELESDSTLNPSADRMDSTGAARQHFDSGRSTHPSPSHARWWTTDVSLRRVGEPEDAAGNLRGKEGCGRSEVLGCPAVSSVKEPVDARHVGKAVERACRRDDRDPEGRAIVDERSKQADRVLVAEPFEFRDHGVDAVDGEQKSVARPTISSSADLSVEVS